MMMACAVCCELRCGPGRGAEPEARGRAPNLAAMCVCDAFKRQRAASVTNAHSKLKDGRINRHCVRGPAYETCEKVVLKALWVQ